MVKSSNIYRRPSYSVTW